MGCGGCNKSKFLISALLSIAYVYFPSQWTKVLPLIYNAMNCADGHYGVGIAWGLIFSALGDVAVENRAGNVEFVKYGLMLYAAANLLYVKGMISLIEIAYTVA